MSVIGVTARIDSRMKLCRLRAHSSNPKDSPASRLSHQASQGGRGPELRGEGLLEYERVIARYPLAALVATFSAGFGLGILATAIFAREDRGWWDRHNLPESLPDVSSGLRRIPGLIAEHLPDSLARR